MYELILMDFSMPECDGPTSSQIMRDLFATAGIPRKDQPYIALLTAFTDKEFHEVALQKQMDAFYIKPIFKSQMQILLHKAGIL